MEHNHDIQMFGIVSVYTNMQAGVSASVRVYVVNTGSCAGHVFSWRCGAMIYTRLLTRLCVQYSQPPCMQMQGS